MAPFFPRGERRDLVDVGLPRQLTVLRCDPHFEPAFSRLSERIDVLLDGEVLPEVARYDVDLGRVDRQRRDATGRLVIERGAPAIETIYGRVEVRWIREAAQ